MLKSELSLQLHLLPASFRTARNLKIHLVRSKLYPLEREKMAHGSVNSNFA